MKLRTFQIDDCIVYRKTKSSLHPGQRARLVAPASNGDTYSYCVDKCVAPPIYRIYVPFFVRLRAGTVESFGRVGDFDSTKTPTTRVEIDRKDKITQDIRVQDSGDMYVELKKLKDLLDTGVITQAEFDAKKKKILEK